MKKKNKIFYLGSFPPPYGGVKIKNKYLFQELQKCIGKDIKKLDTSTIKHNSMLRCYALAKCCSHLKDIWIVGTAAKYRRRITMLLNHYFPFILRKSILIVMGGGNFTQTIREDTAYINALQKYRCIYVETSSMKMVLHSVNITHTSIYPNCRKRPDTMLKIHSNVNGSFKCVFFSQISIEKGIDIVLEAARRLSSVKFDIWGGTILKPSLSCIMQYLN